MKICLLCSNLQRSWQNKTKQNFPLYNETNSKGSTKNHVAFQITRDKFKLVFVFKRCNDGVICSSQKQLVISLSSQHNDQAVSTAEHAKPDIILHYNKSKGAVDNADKMLKEFPCHKISKRWPFVFFIHIINVCALNAYVFYQMKFPNTALTRLKFVKDLGSELVKPAIKTGANPPRTGILLSVQAAMASVIGPLPQQVSPPIPANSGKGKKIAGHSAQDRKTPNIVLNVRYALHTFALSMQNPMKQLI